jgi:hypothetical protein
MGRGDPDAASAGRLEVVRWPTVSSATVGADGSAASAAGLHPRRRHVRPYGEVRLDMGSQLRTGTISLWLKNHVPGRPQLHADNGGDGQRGASGPKGCQA